LGDAELSRSLDFLTHMERHDRMLACYRAQDWTGARVALAECAAYNSELIGLYDLYAERIAHFEANPPGPDWDGVFVSETK
jgi:adenylate cyclase